MTGSHVSLSTTPAMFQLQSRGCAKESEAERTMAKGVREDEDDRLRTCRGPLCVSCSGFARVSLRVRREVVSIGPEVECVSLDREVEGG